eukprot:1943111-Pleurochrysis_carterae.AAC.6
MIVVVVVELVVVVGGGRSCGGSDWAIEVVMMVGCGDGAYSTLATSVSRAGGDGRVKIGSSYPRLTMYGMDVHQSRHFHIRRVRW